MNFESNIRFSRIKRIKYRSTKSLAFSSPYFSAKNFIVFSLTPLTLIWASFTFSQSFNIRPVWRGILYQFSNGISVSVSVEYASNVF